MAAKDGARKFYIGYVECPPSLADHIGRRGLHFDDIRDAVQWPARPTRLDWIDDPQDPRRPRLIARGRTAAGAEIDVVLYPVDANDGSWRLGTAMFVS